MKYLLDTHTLIWLLNGDDNIPSKVVDIIESPKNEIFVSIISFWEIAIKKSLGKLDIVDSTEKILKEAEDSGIKVLDIKSKHVFYVEKLDFHHRDPFDRILIATTITEKLKIISIDEVFDKYKVKRIWG
ncbi:MAG: type II toxin-antitoxin system VapC family toxin [Candidatus Sericytochromatia bacterium]